MKERHLHKQQHGFTLIEVMTSVAIFAIITTIGMGALLSTVGASKQAQAERTALDSLNFIIDAMAREIRTGQKYVQSSNPSDYTEGGNGNDGHGSVFSFHNQESCPVTYRLDDSTGKGIIQRRRMAPCADTTFTNLTDPDVIDVESLTFMVRGADADIADSEQPFVSFVVHATTLNSGKASDITLQSSVTQRLLDIPVVIE